MSSGGGGLAGAAAGVGSGYANRVNLKRGTGANTGHGYGHVDGVGELGAFDFDGQSSLVPGHGQKQGSLDTSQMQFQIYTAEQALREMRQSLSKQRAHPLQNSNPQARPKSQNEAQSYFLAQEMAAAADAMSEESKGGHMGDPLSGSRAGRERLRELSQERQPHGPIFEENQEEELREGNDVEVEEG